LPVRQRVQLPKLEPTGVLLSDATADFLGRYAWGPTATLRNYRQLLEVGFLPFVGDVDLAEITPALCVKFLTAERERGISASWFEWRLRALKGFMRWCVEEGCLQQSPMERIKPPRTPHRIRVGFDREEVKRLVYYAGAGPGAIPVRDRAIVTFLLGTGARASELLGVTLGDLDFANGRIKLHGKGSKDRVVPMGPKVRAALRQWRAVRGRYAEPGRQEWWWTQKRTPMGYATLNSMLNALEERAGVPNVEAHRFRHTFACEYFRAHRDIIALMGMLGHAKVETTQRYLAGLGVDYAVNSGYETPDAWLG
jgi:integrase/recombinase XerD